MDLEKRLGGFTYENFLTVLNCLLRSKIQDVGSMSHLDRWEYLCKHFNETSLLEHIELKLFDILYNYYNVTLNCKHSVSIYSLIINADTDVNIKSLLGVFPIRLYCSTDNEDMNIFVNSHFFMNLLRGVSALKFLSKEYGIRYSTELTGANEDSMNKNSNLNEMKYHFDAVLLKNRKKIYDDSIISSENVNYNNTSREELCFADSLRFDMRPATTNKSVGQRIYKISDNAADNRTKPLFIENKKRGIAYSTPNVIYPWKQISNLFENPKYNGILFIFCVLANVLRTGAVYYQLQEKLYDEYNYTKYIPTIRVSLKDKIISNAEVSNIVLRDNGEIVSNETTRDYNGVVAATIRGDISSSEESAQNYDVVYPDIKARIV